MSIDSTLLHILVCPETKQPVQEGDAALVARLNSNIEEGTLKNVSGEVIREKVDGVLVRQDRKRGYLVRANIPVMLIAEGVPLEG